jgi:hypothetical protein
MAIDTVAQTAYLSAMMADLREEDRPARLAHYTSLATLESILTSRQLWFANPLYMNDLEEMRFGMSEGAFIFRSSEVLKASCAAPERHDYLLDQFNQLYSEFEDTHALDVYVLCLSEHNEGDKDGVLSMWRGYGAHGTGAALLLDTSVFPRYEHLPLIVGKVHYATAQQRREWLTNKVAALAEQIARHDKSDENLRAAVHLWIERLKLFALFSKHHGFAEEKEWRIFYARQRDQGSQLINHISYAITQRGVEPKLKLPFDTALTGPTQQRAGIEVLAEIILGPSQSSQLAQASIRRMVQLLGHPDLADRVYASSIPFRN